MLRSRSRTIGWVKVSRLKLAAVPLSTVLLALCFYLALVTAFDLPEEGKGIAIALLSGSTMFLVGGFCGLKRGYLVTVGFPWAPMIVTGPLIVLQCWSMIGVWAAITLLVGFGYLSQ